MRITEEHELVNSVKSELREEIANTIDYYRAQGEQPDAETVKTDVLGIIDHAGRFVRFPLEQITEAIYDDDLDDCMDALTEQGVTLADMCAHPRDFYWDVWRQLAESLYDQVAAEVLATA